MSDPFETMLRGTVALLSYKTWTFQVEKDAIGLWFLQVVAPDVDVTDGKPMVWSGRKWRVSMHMTRSEIVQTALKAVLAAEEHEARERFLYHGRAIFGPHMNVDRLWMLAAEAPDGRAPP
jgi:hypothetical protein